MEEKIVLATKGESALYLFKRDEQVEFVVAYSNGPVNIGDYVESWANGHYFYKLVDAVEYLETLRY